MAKIGLRAMLVACLWLCPVPATTAAGATTYRVPGNFASVQAAIDGAAAGDTIIVGRGTWHENLKFGGKNLCLTSASPTSAAVVTATVLDGGGWGPVVTFGGAENVSCVLTGFTIACGLSENGGGIRGNGTHATLRYNVITSNTANGNPFGYGGGVYQCDGLIEYNRIAQNRSSGNGGGLSHCGGTVRNNTVTGNVAATGGGLDDCAGRIEGNQIVGNRAESATVFGDGGGLSSCRGTIVRNLIQSNVADGEGGGLSNCQGEVINNLIADNQSEEGGGGISGTCASIRNNVIVRNKTTAGYAHGGGIYASAAFIAHNTLALNTAGGKGGGLAQCRGLLLNNIVWGNVSSVAAQFYQTSLPAYCCTDDATASGTQLVHASPAFKNAGQLDFSLQAGSSCIDKGYDFDVRGDYNADYAGACRWSGTHVDIGAYEYGSSPDADGDLLADNQEAAQGGLTDRADTDGDGLIDGLEVKRGTAVNQANAAGTLTVPAQMTTIQKAICLAFPGDRIVVSAGTYAENLRLPGKNLVLESTNPTAPATVATTVVDGQRWAPVIALSGKETTATTIRGLTLRNGLACENGGGVNGNSSHCNLEYNVIESNEAAAMGGGVAYCYGDIRHNTIQNNKAGTSGGGLAHAEGAIEYNRFINNKALADDGGGISTNSGRIANNLFQGNTCRDDGGGVNGPSWGVVLANEFSNNIAEDQGGAIHIGGSLIARNLIHDNTAYGHGGAVSNATAEIQNNLIRNNHNTNTKGTGDSGGLYNCRGKIINNTIAYNTSQKIGSGISFCPAMIVNCIVWSNSSTDAQNMQINDSPNPMYSCIQGWSPTTQGNINLNPKFVGNGDFHLAANSPCIDAGNSYYLNLATNSDIDGQCRIAGAAVDIGVYEYASQTDADSDLLIDAQEAALGCRSDRADSDGDGLIDGAEVLRHTNPAVFNAPVGMTMPGACPSIQEAVFLAFPHEAITLQPGLYTENLDFLGKNVVLTGTNPLSDAVVAATVLDGGGIFSVITLRGDEDASTTIRGLTIRNGRAVKNGGGINAQNAKATIERNRIVDNTAAETGGGIASPDGEVRYNTIARNQIDYPYANGGGISRGAGHIHHNRIENNEVKGSLAYGGGIAYAGGACEDNEILDNRANYSGGGLYGLSGVARRNLIRNNKANSGGGVANGYGTIEDNVITSNSAVWGGGGLYWCSGAILNNQITSNTATQRGGGIYYSNGRVEANEIAWNRAGTDGGGIAGGSAEVLRNRIHRNQSAGDGGGLAECNGTMRNNLVYANLAMGNGGGLARCLGAVQNNTIALNTATLTCGGCYSSTKTLQNCILWGNAAPKWPQGNGLEAASHCCIQNWSGAGIENISGNPYFVDIAHENFHLQVYSSCADMGMLVADLLVDYDGAPRGFNCSARWSADGSEYDIGAYELQTIRNAADRCWTLYD